MECLAHLLEQKYPQFNTVSPRHSLRDALYQMSCEHLDYLIVLDNEEFIGILSEQDVVHKILSRDKPLDELQVRDIMNHSIPVGNAKDSLDFAIQVLHQYNSRYVAVFEELEFKGIVSENDLLRHTIRNKDLAEEKAYTDVYHWSY